MEDSIKFRLANAEDCSELLPALLRRTFTDTFGHLYPPEELEACLSSAYDPSVLRAEISDPRVRAWVVEDLTLDGVQAVAFAQVGPCRLPHAEASPEHFEVKRVYILKSHQGQGLGRRIMDVVMEWGTSPAAGFSGPMWVGVYSANLRAQNLYSRYGFSKAGEYEFIVGQSRDREFIFKRERA